MLLSVQNNLDQLPTALNSYLSTNISAGTTSLPVKNINSFTNQYAVQIGRTGEEQAEITIIGVPSGTALPINSGTLVYDHPVDTPVYSIHYDQIIFKRSVAGTSGAASAISTVSITPDSVYTEYNDASGAQSYAYKTQYYNSVSGDTSAESDWFTPSGPDFYSLASMRGRIKSRLANANYIKSDDVITDWINEWLEEMNNAAIKVNKDYLLGTTAVSFGTTGLGTITVANFVYPRKIEITYDGVTWIPTTKININEFSDNDFFSAVAPRHYWDGDTVIGFLPSGQAGTARITYSQGETILQNETDVLPYPMRTYSRSFVQYALYCAYENDQKLEYMDRSFAKAQDIKTNFINEISPRDQTGPQNIQILDSLSAFEEDLLVTSDWYI